MLKFALGGLAATIVLAAAGALALSKIGRTQAIDEAKNLTEVTGRGIVEPALGEGLLRGDRRALARLDRVVRRRVLTGDVVRVKIWSASGRVLYSDRRQLIGSRYGLGADDLEVLRHGGVQADISDLARPENRFERGAGKLLEVYLPIETPSGRRVLYETYLRFRSVEASGRSLWGDFLPALIGALVVLQLVQLPLAYGLARRVERSQREREELLRRSLAASEIERRRIAADLHDGTVQELVAAQYGLSSTRERLEPGDPARDALLRAEQTTRRAVGELRSLLVEIYPPRLREAGLASVLEDMVTPLAERGIDATVESAADMGLDDEATALLYRTAREAVRNAVEHANPTEIRITVGRENGRVALSVADDGSGFEPNDALARPAEGHFGLRLLSDQVRDAGGRFEIDSEPGKGTLLRVEVPAR